MNWETLNWPALARLRTAFLAGTAGAADYWRDDRDLESYDQTFAQRIGWKWDHVLAELAQRNWSPPDGVVVDWGCGTGIAARAFLGKFGAAAASQMMFWDRSPLAMQFAARRARAKFPGLNVWLDAPPDHTFGTLLLSHVLTELSDQQTEELLIVAGHARAVIWVEPGTPAVSRRLIALRERLQPVFQIVAPCPHQGHCGLLQAGNERHWCHHFAQPPPQVFTDGNWTRFAKIAGVDLRSLPVSYLVLDKRPVPAGPALRVIGRPRVYKAHALLLGCDDTGVRDRPLQKRDHPEEFRRWKKGR